ncbi:MAG: alpha/beta hydrolase [Ktedonobacteraceae bacterium]|nr:alpha/beta hydrolase [Ktedonobacteraceae bacterium]
MIEPVQQDDELSQQLSAFRATHTMKHCSVKNTESMDAIDWEYFSSGYGNETLLLLPGVHGRGEAAFQHILRFEQGYRVISPSYPSSVTTIEQIITGLASILQAERIKMVYVVGGSYSGMIAQCLVRSLPEQVKMVVLDHTSPPSISQARLYALYRIVLTVLPISWLRRLLTFFNQRATQEITIGQDFWRDYFETLLVSMSRADYLNRMQVCIDFYRNYTFSPDDLLTWRGKMLIIESDNDAYVSKRQRAVLRALYPKAHVHTFHHTGHAAWANQFEAFFSVIAQFLQEEL